MMLAIGQRIIGQAENVISGGMIQPRQADQHIGGDIPQTTLIAAVLGLFHGKIIRNLLLRKIVILSQIAQTGIIVVRNIICLSTCPKMHVPIKGNCDNPAKYFPE